MSANGRVDVVVVVGGGIGGLGSALALGRAGHRVRVLERSPEFGEVGAGLQMAPNATRILRAWGLLDEVVARGFLPRLLVMRDAVDGAQLSHLDLHHAAARYGGPYVVIHRSDLHAILVDACRDTAVDLVTSAAVTDVDADGRGAVAVGPDRRDAASVVLAADGLGSRLRRRLSADEPAMRPTRCCSTWRSAPARPWRTPTTSPGWPHGPTRTETPRRWVTPLGCATPRIAAG